MSSVYNLEPQPTGSVILHTSYGELLVELFAKQTPLTCRNFLQHCVDGYYDDTRFHRLVPGFLLQGGDPSGTGHGGESIYDGGAMAGDREAWPMAERTGANAGPHGVGFPDEFHSRLRYTRRGLVGMANDGRPHTNGSQFFFTLAPAPALNQKNTLFGRVAGDTIYNLLKMGDAEVDTATERPLYPVQITRTEVLVNPFADMRPRRTVLPPTDPTQQTKMKQTKTKQDKKKKKGKALLSFAEGGDEAEEDQEAPPKKAKFDTRIVADPEDDDHTERKPKTSRSPLRVAKSFSPSPQPVDSPKPVDESHMTKQAKDRDRESMAYSEPQKPEIDETYDEIARLKASLRNTRTHHHAPGREEASAAVTKSALEAMIPEKSMRGRKRQRASAAAVSEREEAEALARLQAFQSKLDTARDSTARNPKANDDDARADKRKAGREGDQGDREDGGEDGGEDGEYDQDVCDLHFIPQCQSCRSWAAAADGGGGGASDEDDGGEREDVRGSGWMAHRLTFAADRLGKDLTFRQKAEEELVVIDPREKAQARREKEHGHGPGAGHGHGHGHGSGPVDERGTGRKWDVGLGRRNMGI